MTDREQDRLHRLSVAILEAEPIAVLVAGLATGSFVVWILSSGTWSAVAPYQPLAAAILALPTFAFYVDVVSFAIGRKTPYSEALWG